MRCWPGQQPRAPAIRRATPHSPSVRRRRAWSRRLFTNAALLWNGGQWLEGRAISLLSWASQGPGILAIWRKTLPQFVHFEDVLAEERERCSTCTQVHAQESTFRPAGVLPDRT